MGVGEAVVKNLAVTIDAPASGSGVADEELMVPVIVRDLRKSMAAKVGFGGLGHRDELNSIVDGDFGKSAVSV